VTTRHYPYRIALLCESFGALGGVAQIVEELAEQVALAGHRAAIISNPLAGPGMARRLQPGIEQVRIDLPRAKPFSLRHPERLWRRRAASELRAFLRKWSPDVINIHGGLRDRFPAVLTACRQTGVPLVQSFHLVPEPFQNDAESSRMNGFSAKALRTASAITVPSSAVKRGLQNIWPEAERAQIIRGGVNLEAAERAAPLYRARPYIFSASRLDLRHKAVDVVIEAFRLVAAEFPEVDLLIAGDGPQRGEVEAMIAASKLEPRIHLLSSLPHSELWSLYKGALMFIMLSRMAEGLPLVFFEAMACSIPVIATRNGGTPEIVVHNQTGILIGSNESGYAAQSIRSLLTDPRRREQMGRNSYELAKSYDWQAVAASYLALYQQLLAARER
jgi:glycosyltransferase involved in cell wall biosynthesis